MLCAPLVSVVLNVDILPLCLLRITKLPRLGSI